TYNAITPALLERLNESLRTAIEDEDVYAIVLTGAGEGFCSGVDTAEVGGWEDLSREEYAGFLRTYQHCVRQLHASAVPSIAAIDGPAVGGGCGLALGCNLRFVSDAGYLRPNFTRLGIVPVDGTAWLLGREIGRSRARQYLLPGDDLDADMLVDLGLAVECVEDPRDAAQALAARLVDRPARAVRRTNQLIGFDGDLETYFTQGIEHQWACLGDTEHAEAVAAMRDGRDPEYDRPR
ncbi:MAG: enoyl-CoA hydratase/isomerase family protein, partial [Salinirussus sp.]